MVRAGAAPVAEPGLISLITAMVSRGRLRATEDGAAAAAASDVALICVATPPQPGGGLDIGAVRAVGELIGPVVARADRPCTVVLRSTVMPGTTEGVLRPALGAARSGSRVRVAVNPEFLRAGSALTDAEAPPFILAGCDGDEAAAVVRALYGWLDAPFVRTDLGTAEMVKCVSNAFHALKVAFANEVADLCAALAADATEIMRVFALDRKLNVGPAYLRPGFAFGGPCLEKDLAALGAAGRHAGWDLPLLSAILPSNARQIARASESIETPTADTDPPRPTAPAGPPARRCRGPGVQAGGRESSRQPDGRAGAPARGRRRRRAGPGPGRHGTGMGRARLPAVVRCDTVAELLADVDVGPDAAAVATEARGDQLVLDLGRGDFRVRWARRCAGNGAAPPDPPP